jgi:hypothetical protein
MFTSTWVEIIFDSAFVIVTLILILQVIMDFIKSEPRSHGEMYLTSSRGESEMTDVREEDPVTFQALKAEHEVKLVFVSEPVIFVVCQCAS